MECGEQDEIPDPCRLSTYDYHLPGELVANEPSQRRDHSRLLLIHRLTGKTKHLRFTELADILRPTDLLVINETKVVPAALFGTKATGGRVELLVLDPAAPDKGPGCHIAAPGCSPDCGTGPSAGLFRPDHGRLESQPHSIQPSEATGDRPACRVCMVKSSKPLKCGAGIRLEGGAELVVEEALGAGRALIRFPAVESEFLAFLEQNGLPPLPPYISRKDRVLTQDLERYQTVYCRAPGSVAAPTAGLHFTRELMDRLGGRGIEIARVLLHVGAGTFTPVRDEDIRLHNMQPEYYEITEHAAEAVSKAVGEGRRVVAVGTTTVRVLEGTADGTGQLKPGRGWTNLFITPGYSFKLVGGLVTNFHLPKSTLLMLTCAFGGTGQVLNAYEEAAGFGYLFYSYGDVCVIID